MPRECLKIIESKSKVRQSRTKAVVAKVSTSSSTPAVSSEVVELKDMVRALLLNKKNQSSAPASSSTPAPVKAIEPSCVTCGGLGTLPSNTITNPKEDLKGITTRSGVAYQGPPIPTPSKVVKQRTKVTKDQVQTTSSQSTAPVQPPVIRSETQTLVSEPVVAPALIGNKEKLSEMARTPMNEHCLAVILNKLPRKLGDPVKFLIPYEFPGMDECLALADLGASINLMPLFVWEGLSLPELTPTCMTIELADRSVSKPVGIAKDVSVKVGVFHFPADFVNQSSTSGTLRSNTIPNPKGEMKAITTHSGVSYEGPSIPTPKKVVEQETEETMDKEQTNFQGTKTVKSFVDEPPEVELKDLPPHLKYAFLKGDNKFPVIIAKELGDEEKSALIKVLKSYKRAIAWKLSDIQGINPEFCTHKILMEEDHKPLVQHQIQVNTMIHDIIKKEVKKLLDAGLIYPISDSPWVSPVHCVPKKGGFTVFENEENELIPTCLVTEWRVSIDYQKLNEATRKDHFSLPFMDQMLERLAGNEYYCFLNGFFGCMLAIFHDMVEKTMEVFMDDFSVFGNSFENCLSRLDKMLQRCEDTNLCLNWEKSHFMVKEGIVLGHKISKYGIEVDKAKIDVIAKLPHPTTVKGIQSFLGDADFYRRFIQDFSKISRPMTHLLEKNTPFIFSEDCIKAFQMLKKKLTEAPILIAPNWDLPFELMCDASDFAICAVLGQRHEKHFKPIHYAS
nr:DNA-directed DNA polymerase [Tanacetum cinerariifolium]